MREGLGLAGLPPTAVGREMAFGSHTGQRQLLDQVCSVLFCLKAGASLRLYWRPPGEGSLEPRQKVIKMLSLWTKSKDFTSPAPSTLRPWRIKTSKCHEALRGHTQEDFIPGRKESRWAGWQNFLQWNSLENLAFKKSEWVHSLKRQKLTRSLAHWLPVD